MTWGFLEVAGVPTSVAAWETFWDRLVTWLIGDGLRVLLTIVLALVVRWLAHRAIDRVVAVMTSRSRSEESVGGRAGRVLAQATGLAHARHVQRVTTLGSLLRSIVTFVVALIATLTVMALVGLPLGPLLASAGVGGVALGFGAQSLVKDFLSGVFMIFEDQYGVGDVVDTGEAVGTVEEVGLRVTRLRDANGVVWYIRNGEIVRIGNKSQGWSTATVDSPVAYDENAERVIGIIRGVARTFDADPEWQESLLEEPDVVGVESISGQTMTIRTVAKCAPNQNFAVQRELRERIKAALDAAGVKAPPVAPFGGPVGGAR
ncbi:MAG: mechanosensitive ion channel family protein [Actinobacteria bacterium]|jgi:Small-conductance mechanosensitive channel|nr:mechanosensitive ion channel family protein [Actinomycetota bacterium]